MNFHSGKPGKSQCSPIYSSDYCLRLFLQQHEEPKPLKVNDFLYELSDRRNSVSELMKIDGKTKTNFQTLSFKSERNCEQYDCT